MKPGWYPDPDDPAARRYWDGQEWSAPLPMAGGAHHSPTTGAVEAAGTCAVGPCTAHREPGRLYCANHGPAEPTEWERRALASGVASPFQADPRAASAGRGGTPGFTGQRAIVCPHCGVQGKVHRKSKKVKRGISGGKATAAVFTLGFSMLGTGLSRKEQHFEMHCGNCGTTWLV